MLDYRILTFLTVCRTLNYTRAAEELSITQPAVSQHIAHLEHEYGAKLFSMRGKTPSLTAAGELLRTACATVAHDQQLLRDRIAGLGAGASTMSIGMTLTAGEYIAAEPLAQWMALHPRVRVSVHSGDTRTLLNLLDRGLIDCAFIEGQFDRSAYRCDVLCREQLACVCVPQHQLAGTTCGYSELTNQDLIVREPGSGTRSVLQNALAAHNITIESFAQVTEVSSIGVIKVLACHGAGVTFLYRAAVRRELAEGSLCEIELEGAPIEHDIAFVRLAGSAFEQQFDQFFDEMRTLHLH